MNWMEPEQFEMRQAPIKPRKIPVDMAIKDARLIIERGFTEVSDLHLPEALIPALDLCSSLEAMERIVAAAAYRASVLRKEREALERAAVGYKFYPQEAAE